MSGVALNGQALSAAVEAAAQEAQSLGLEPRNQAAQRMVIRAALRAYLRTAKAFSALRDRTSPQTRELMAMKVGDHLVGPTTAHQVWRSRMKTARRLMENPLASWVCRDGLEGTMVIRRADGSRSAHDPTENPRAVWLAAMQVGDCRIAPAKMFPTRYHTKGAYRAAARKILENDAADWSCRTINQGLRVTRTR